MSKSALVSVVGVALVLTGCTTASDDKGTNTGSGADSTTASATTTSATAVQTEGGNPTAAPEPTREVITSSAPKVETPAAMWNPCDIAGADIARLGYGAGSKQVVDGSDGGPGCRWQSATGKSEVTILSDRQTLADLQKSGRYVDFTPVRAAGHDAYRYRAAQDSNKIGCYISFAVAGGQTTFVTRNLKADAPEPCEATRALVDGLTSYLN